MSAHIERHSTFWGTARILGWRNLHNFFTNPSLIIPALLFPLFFFTAFAGGLSQVSEVPGFDYPLGYTAFQFVFVLLQSAAFGGVFTGFGVARDFESGFARRLLLASPNRSGRSRQGAPDRSTQKIPLRTRRSSTRATPRDLCGSIPRRMRHSASESS